MRGNDWIEALLLALVILGMGAALDASDFAGSERDERQSVFVGERGAGVSPVFQDAGRLAGGAGLGVDAGAFSHVLTGDHACDFCDP